MEFKDLYTSKEEQAKISALYEIFNEDERLVHSKSAQVEFLTSVHYINQVLRPDMKILDLGAGTGIYSLYYAEKGYEVTAVELVRRNYEVFLSKIKDNHKINLHHGSALDLSLLLDKSFDVILLFGPLYHLEDEEERKQCLKEALRVLKDDGTIFIAFINHDMIFMTETEYNPECFSDNTYNHETMRISNFPFVFFTIDECRKMLKNNKIEIQKEIASDGFRELMAKSINEMSDYSYQQYLKYHFYRCEKKELLGASNHLLFQGKKKII